MPKLAHPDCASVELLYSCTQGPLMENTLYFKRGGLGAFTNTEIEALVDAAITAWAANVQQYTTSIVSLIGARGQSLNQLPYGPVLETLLENPLPGQAAGDAFPLFAAAGIQFIGESGGIPRRSYIRMPGLPESAANGNVLDAPERANYITAWQTLTDAVRDAGPAGTVHVILSEMLNGAAVADDNPVEFVTCATRLFKAASRSGTGG